jgi:hypothetical protein
MSSYRVVGENPHWQKKGDEFLLCCALQALLQNTVVAMSIFLLIGILKLTRG